MNRPITRKVLTLDIVNCMIRDIEGIEARLEQCDGTFRFVGASVEAASDPVVRVSTINELDIVGWFIELDRVVTDAHSKGK